MSKEIRINEVQQERPVNKTISDIFKASLVGILAVVITVIPFEQFIAQIVGVSYAEFRGGMPTLYLFPLFLIYAAIAFVFAKMNRKIILKSKPASKSNPISLPAHCLAGHGDFS